MTRIFFFFAAVAVLNISCASKNPFAATCVANPKLQEKRSKELQDLVNADQADREGLDMFSDEQVAKLIPRDEARRKRVGEIFGEGCFKTAQDYAAGALVYQHGIVPDHFMQSFMWANKAVELGDKSQKSLVAMSVDRYLVKSGHRQLFGTQADRAGGKNCFCLNAIESSFPDSKRKTYTSRGVKGAQMWVRSLNHQDEQCKAVTCSEKLAASPRGTVPGFW